MKNQIELEIESQYKYFRQIKILLRRTIEFNSSRISTKKEDTQESFDMLLYLDDMVEKRISIRLRGNQYSDYNDLTIRCKGKFKDYSELGKINDGKGETYFYGYLNKEKTKIVKWVLVDINKIRTLKNNNNITRNSDGSAFISYGFNQLFYYDCILDYGGFKRNQLEEYIEQN